MTDDADLPVHQIDVSFASGTVTFGGSGIDANGNIDIDIPGGRIVLKLALGRAKFPTFPVQWTTKIGDYFQPIVQPPQATITRQDDQNAEIVIKSSTPGERFSFFVTVLTQVGRFFGTDPTIVTMRPGGPPGSDSPNE